MNARINELKRMATLWCDDNIPEQFSEETGGYGGAWEDKFAELIVQECAEYVRHWNYAAIRNDMEYGVSSDEILEYFGVKQ